MTWAGGFYQVVFTKIVHRYHEWRQPLLEIIKLIVKHSSLCAIIFNASRYCFAHYKFYTCRFFCRYRSCTASTWPRAENWEKRRSYPSRLTIWGVWLRGWLLRTRRLRGRTISSPYKLQSLRRWESSCSIVAVFLLAASTVQCCAQSFLSKSYHVLEMKALTIYLFIPMT